MPNYSRAALIALLSLLLLGCGGGDAGSGSNISGSSAPEICTSTALHYCPASVFNDPFGIALTFAWYSGQCTETVACANDPLVVAGVDPDTGTVSQDFIEENWLSSGGDESEPNDSSDQSDVFLLGPRRGYLYDATLNDFSDPVDYLTFAVEDDGGSYHIYLCRSPDLCTEQRITTGLHLVLYDQNLVELNSTALNLDGEEHWIDAPTLTLGLRYYIGIHATNTSSLDEAYRLVITD